MGRKRFFGGEPQLLKNSPLADIKYIYLMIYIQLDCIHNVLSSIIEKLDLQELQQNVIYMLQHRI